MSRNVSTFLIPLLLLPAAARSQLVEEYNPPKANCCLAGFAHSLADQLQDWNQLGRYHQDNERLKALPAEPRMFTSGQLNKYRAFRDSSGQISSGQIFASMSS